MENFAAPFVEGLVQASLARLALVEDTAVDGPLLPLSALDAAGQRTQQGAGFLRRWVPRSHPRVDRMIHVRLLSGPVDTELFFLFGQAGTPMPHFHTQVVQFAADACVFNADVLPRLDPVDYPAYYATVMHPLNRAYWQAINEAGNVCSHAPGNPALAAYLSPWSIGTSRPTTRSELVRVTDCINSYLNHWLTLAECLDFEGPPAAALAARDARHLACFASEELDPRAWKGVYRLVGEDAGRELRRLMLQPVGSR
jgi:hypothetical protein